ncbi:MAG: tetratricopeptide repeat protein [Pirellulaceae bacterium]|nr:tetratricopeptide repeat protein [Pirellulaceae bacterium]
MDRSPRLWRIALVLGLLATLACGGSGASGLMGIAAAQDAAAPAQSPVTAAYQRAQQATTVDEMSEVIAECERLRGTELSEANADYVVRLLAFVQNRRGELYANQATDLQEQGGAQRAAELDALALADFEASVANDPSRWKSVHNRGVSYAVQGEYEKAVRDFSRAVELKPDYPNAWFNRGEIRYELGQFEEAARDYTRAIQLNPQDEGSYTSRGHCYFQLGRYNPALADYNRAVQLAPESAVARVNRGDAYRSLSSWQQAAADYRQAIQLDGRSSRAYQSAAWLMATCPDARYRNPELAVQAAERAVQLEGRDDHRLLDTLAAAYANANRFDEAVASLEKALPLAPEGESEMLERRLKLYQARQPYRQSASSQ